ncbi:SRPBCC family protein [Patulibacter defluvii]|uniref:SRPBCC family protein n=1 Tax=Patulibacter defluvii TaxID=3095358 RepID=UPI002A74830E|nr:SRPBCC domain-containing protein [Patulibacter sp. DM4]
MPEQTDIRWEQVLPGTPDQVWQAITQRADGWLWPIEYEPRVGGAERGLTSSGGTVTAWEPGRHFQTRATRPDGWHNTLDYRLEPDPGGTAVRYRHLSLLTAEEHDACVRHTDFYRHALTTYVRDFAGRVPAYVSVEVPATLADLRRAIGVDEEARVGDQVRAPLTGAALDLRIDYVAPAFLGLRGDDALIRCFGREAWGGGLGITLHLFAPGADAQSAADAWRALASTTTTTTTTTTAVA